MTPEDHGSDSIKNPYSPYRTYSIKEWAKLRRNTRIPLTEEELEKLRGINERASMEEVSQVYLPLSRLISLYVESVQRLNRGTQQFMGVQEGKVPFIIGIAGSVAVGKSTVARILQTLLGRWPEHPKVDLITTDGFLYSTAELQRRNLMHRKGFPESFDREALLQLLSDVKGGRGNLRAPIYSHLRYDVVPGEFITIDQPDILIVEGLNVLQTGKLRPDEAHVFVSDYFDISIYIDAREDVIRNWYVDRFLTLRDTVFSNPESYFSHYAKLDTEEATRTANEIWSSINLVNLRENILPTRERAKLILHKGSDHAIDSVRLRKL
ncbi:MAG: type I pantothenate kinase [Granulosicoccus sp.]|nr:type I pantothenate kinase [Granulosicoccus sp.]